MDREALGVVSNQPKPSDLIAFLPFACLQLQAPFRVRILVETIEEYVNRATADDKGKKTKRDRTTSTTPTSTSHQSAQKEVSVADSDEGAREVVICARCDITGRPVELSCHRCSQVPQLLIKIIGLCIPFNEQLAKITIRWVPLHGSVLYEIAKFLPLSQVTEIRLDDSPVRGRNYHLLLERQSQLRCLSLARCGLADEDCAALAALLVHPLPASRRLACLCLESNRIGDAGAVALGEALRTNRTLRHLNLAGNAITNVGAAHILRSLTKFPLSGDDVVLKRRRTFEYLKRRRDAFARCYRELMQVPDAGHGRVRTAGGRARRGGAAFPPVATLGSGVDALASRAEAMVLDLVGAPADTIGPTELMSRGDATYCAGNFCLTYLNLAYNDLDRSTAERLAEVLAYQVGAGRRGCSGLLRVVLEGNALPTDCAAARTAERLLERLLVGAAGQQLVKPGRKSDRLKLKGN